MTIDTDTIDTDTIGPDDFRRATEEAAEEGLHLHQSEWVGSGGLCWSWQDDSSTLHVDVRHWATADAAISAWLEGVR